MTKEQFEKRYTSKSGLTIEELWSTGLHGIPCDCGEEGCEGWAMESREKQVITAKDVGRIEDIL